MLHSQDGGNANVRGFVKDFSVGKATAISGSIDDAVKGLIGETMGLTLRPCRGDRERVIAAVLQWVVDNLSTQGVEGSIILEGDVGKVIERLRFLSEQKEGRPLDRVTVCGTMEMTYQYSSFGVGQSSDKLEEE
jgi:hypothetical protein